MQDKNSTAHVSIWQVSFSMICTCHRRVFVSFFIQDWLTWFTKTIMARACFYMPVNGLCDQLQIPTRHMRFHTHLSFRLSWHLTRWPINCQGQGLSSERILKSSKNLVSHSPLFATVLIDYQCRKQARHGAKFPGTSTSMLRVTSTLLFALAVLDNCVCINGDNNRIASCVTCALEAIHPKRAGASEAFLNRVTGSMYSNVRTQGIAEDVNLR